jgi:hypothetical protein
MNRVRLLSRFLRSAVLAVMPLAWFAAEASAQYKPTWVKTLGNRESSGFHVFSRELAPDGSLWIAALAVRTHPREPWTQWGSLLLLRYDAEGHLVWSKNQHGTSLFPTLIGAALRVDAEGCAYVATYLDQLRTLTKFSPGGVELWTRHLDLDWQGEPELPMAIDREGRILIAGNTPHVSSEKRDLRLLQYDPDGNLRWQVTHDGPLHGFDYSHHVAVDANGRVHLTAVCSVMPYEPGNVILSLAFDGDGSLMWSSAFPASSEELLRAQETEVLPDGTRTIAVGIHDPDAYWWSQTAFALVRVGPSGERPWTAIQANVPLNSRECTALRTAPWGDLIVAGANLKYESPTTFFVHVRGLAEGFSPTGEKLWSQRSITQATDTRFEDVLLLESEGRVGLVTSESGNSGSTQHSFSLEFLSNQGVPIAGQRIELPGAGGLVVPTGLVDSAGDLRLIGAASLPWASLSWVLYVARYTAQ